jgi:hypothetical protein
MRRSRMMLRTLSDRTTVTRHQHRGPDGVWQERVALTFILPDVLEGEGETGVLALDDAHLAKGALADDA